MVWSTKIRKQCRKVLLFGTRAEKFKLSTNVFDLLLTVTWIYLVFLRFQTRQDPRIYRDARLGLGGPIHLPLFNHQTNRGCPQIGHGDRWRCPTGSGSNHPFDLSLSSSLRKTKVKPIGPGPIFYARKKKNTTTVSNAETAPLVIVSRSWPPLIFIIFYRYPHVQKTFSPFSSECSEPEWPGQTDGMSCR